MISVSSSQEVTAPAPIGAAVTAPSIPTFADGAVFSSDDTSLSAAALVLLPAAGTSGAPANPLPTLLSIELQAAVALILRLVMDAKSITADEAIARAICIYADHIGIPTLARPIDEASTRQATANNDDFRRGGIGT